MARVNIFVSYCHKDSQWVEEGPSGLIPWLADSLRRDDVAFWFDHALRKLPGEEYKQVIREEIGKAQFACLLISQDFLNSDFIRTFELPWIKERVDRGELVIIPILVGPTLWEGEAELRWLTERQWLPGKPTPLIEYRESEAKYKQVCIDMLAAFKHRISRMGTVAKETRDATPATGILLERQDAVPGMQAAALPKRVLLSAIALLLLFLLGWAVYTVLDKSRSAHLGGEVASPESARITMSDGSRRDARDIEWGNAPEGPGFGFTASLTLYQGSVELAIPFASIKDIMLLWGPKAQGHAYSRENEGYAFVTKMTGDKVEGFVYDTVFGTPQMAYFRWKDRAGNTVTAEVAKVTRIEFPTPKQ